MQFPFRQSSSVLVYPRLPPFFCPSLISPTLTIPLSFQDHPSQIPVCSLTETEPSSRWPGRSHLCLLLQVLKLREGLKCASLTYLHKIISKEKTQRLTLLVLIFHNPCEWILLVWKQKLKIEDRGVNNVLSVKLPSTWSCVLGKIF